MLLLVAGLSSWVENACWMAGILKPQAQGAFIITPHKVSLCILLQVYAPPAQISVPFPFSSVSQHNRLGLFLLALTKVLLNSFSIFTRFCVQYFCFFFLFSIFFCDKFEDRQGPYYWLPHWKSSWVFASCQHFITQSTDPFERAEKHNLCFV